MQIDHTIAELRQALVGTSRSAFVPTMGNLHEGHLYGVSVFEDGEDEGSDAATGTVFAAVLAELDALVLKAFVEITVTVAAERGRSAEGTVDFDVLTAIGKTCH